jgi:serine/threonine-protein kinase
MFKPRQRFHVFIIVRLLGMGGVAEVYEALHMGKRCALKVLQRRFHLDDAQRARAEKEAEVLTRIHQENVVDVHEAGIHDGIFWMRMDFIEGIDLRTAIHRLAPMSVGLAAVWAVQASHGVHQCHVFGVIHRDVKPENVFITREGKAKVIDLGIAKMYGDLDTIQTGEKKAPVGTAPYMSPEQAKGQDVTTASDVYALALVFWEMVVGSHPFLGGGQVYEYWAMLHKQVHEEVPPLADYGYPAYLSDIVARAVSKDWRLRPSSALAFAKELGDACKRYEAEHPEEERPGEPKIRAMLDELLKPRKFGTGPMPAHRSSLPPSRPPKKPRTAQGLGPSTVAVTLPASANRPAAPVRHHTQPMERVVVGDAAAPGVPPVTMSTSQTNDSAHLQNATPLTTAVPSAAFPAPFVPLSQRPTTPSIARAALPAPSPWPARLRGAGALSVGLTLAIVIFAAAVHARRAPAPAAAVVTTASVAAEDPPAPPVATGTPSAAPVDMPAPVEVDPLPASTPAPVPPPASATAVSSATAAPTANAAPRASAVPSAPPARPPAARPAATYAAPPSASPAPPPPPEPAKAKHRVFGSDN